jgi:hypothetical protein
MADDDRRGDEQEPKITVRDRRRVTAEGNVREVPEEPKPQAPPPPPPPPPSARPEAPPPPRRRPGGSSALGGADQARVRAGEEARRLREVPSESEPEGPPPGAEEMPPVRDIYDYVAAVANEMTIWTLSALGLVANPLTRIVAVNLDQAEFAKRTAESLIELLGEVMPPEDVIGLHQNFVVQFASVAAQLLQQPPQVRLAEIQKIRFCIDAADGFLNRLTALGDETETQASELTRLVGELKLRFLQASGGGSIIG